MKKLPIGIAFAVIGLLIGLPFAGIAAGALQNGPGPFLRSLGRPEAVHAMTLSLVIIVIVTLLNAMVGIYLSLEMVRGLWIARGLKPIVNAIIDLPFAVSPVIAGLMVILLFGPDAMIGAFFESHGV